jgi:hypothetical protein
VANVRPDPRGSQRNGGTSGNEPMPLLITNADNVTDDLTLALQEPHSVTPHPSAERPICLRLDLSTME